jgi:hypothetical protein
MGGRGSGGGPGGAANRLNRVRGSDSSSGDRGGGSSSKNRQGNNRSASTGGIQTAGGGSGSASSVPNDYTYTEMTLEQKLDAWEIYADEWGLDAGLNFGEYVSFDEQPSAGVVAKLAEFGIPWRVE